MRLLRITDIQNGRVNWDSVPGCQITNDEIPKYQLNDNDVLIARTGGTIGKSFLVRNVPVTAVFASYLIRVIPSNLFSADYLSVFLRSSLYWDQLRESSAGTGQPNVNGEALSQLAIPVPPVAEQPRIVAKVEELLALCDELEARQSAARQQRKRLVRSALDHFATRSSRSRHESALTETKPGKSLSGLTSAAARNDEDAFKHHAAFVLREFPQLTAAPEDIPALRQAILSLAVQGHLIPQGAKDEPAGLVVENARSAKQQLTKKVGH